MANGTLDIDLVSQSFMRNPLPTLTRLREAGPVVRVRAPLLGKAWVATTLEAVSEVLKDKDSPERGSPPGVARRSW
jgi:cytochrome P450